MKKRQAVRKTVRLGRPKINKVAKSMVEAQTLPDICVRSDFPLVISGYTVSSHIGDYYKRASARLSKSLLKFDLPHIIFPLQDAKNWAKNCALKQTLILHVLERMRCPVLWIDIDGEVFKFPEVFVAPKFDIALVNYSGHWLTGTLYLSTNTTNFVREWKDKTKPFEPDEVSLLHIYQNTESGLKLQMLDRAYNEVVHAKTDTSKIVVGHYIRGDVACERRDSSGNPLKAVPLGNPFGNPF